MRPAAPQSTLRTLPWEAVTQEWEQPQEQPEHPPHPPWPMDFGVYPLLPSPAGEPTDKQTRAHRLWTESFYFLSMKN